MVGKNRQTAQRTNRRWNLAKTTVVHNLREDFDVYIGREVPEHGLPASKWGNPFVMQDMGDTERNRALAAYRQWVMRQPELIASLQELSGRRLGCWCAPQRCHGDVLVELIESLPDPE